MTKEAAQNEDPATPSLWPIAKNRPVRHVLLGRLWSIAAKGYAGRRYRQRRIESSTLGSHHDTEREGADLCGND